MRLNILVELPDDATADDAAQALRDAGDRAGGQIEYRILTWPLEVDENILLGPPVLGVEVNLYRSE